MLDSLIVGAIIVVAALFVGRRLYKQFTAKTPGCGCAGCGGNCSTEDNATTPSCGNAR
jgi:hypothetical protein